MMVCLCRNALFCISTGWSNSQQRPHPNQRLAGAGMVEINSLAGNGSGGSSGGGAGFGAFAQFSAFGRGELRECSA